VTTEGSARPSGELTIRDVRMEDYELVQRLWDEAGLPFRPEGRDRQDRVSREMRLGTAVFLLAERDGRLAGVVLGTHDGRKGWINRLAVAPVFQRQGIASRLVREVEARLEALGLEVIAALIESANEESLSFFKAIGYLHDSDIEYVSRRRSAES
jgi:ribosomal protein S18 acetylase RimI-like enzyme